MDNNNLINLKEFEDLATLNVEGISDEMLQFGALMSMDDEHFNVLAPSLMQQFQQLANSPEMRLELATIFNTKDLSAENLKEAIDTLSKELDKTDLSETKKDFIIGVLGVLLSIRDDTKGVSQDIIVVSCETCNDNAKIPDYAHITDSGMDVYAVEDIIIKPGETALIPTGIKVALPAGYEFQVRPKSGRSLKTKLRIANTPGTIDQDYRDEIKIIVENINPPIKDIEYDFDENGEIKIKSILHGESYTITKGEKICQLVLAGVAKCVFAQVTSVKEIGDDRMGGFGSSSIYAKDDVRYKTDLVDGKN